MITHRPGLPTIVTDEPAEHPAPVPSKVPTLPPVLTPGEAKAAAAARQAAIAAAAANSQRAHPPHVLPAPPQKPLVNAAPEHKP